MKEKRFRVSQSITQLSKLHAQWRIRLVHRSRIAKRIFPKEVFSGDPVHFRWRYAASHPLGIANMIRRSARCIVHRPNRTELLGNVRVRIAPGKAKTPDEDFD